MLEKIFRREWIFAGHVSEVSKAGSYKTFRVGDQHCFLLRDGDGCLRAFYNVCRHRGHVLLPLDSKGTVDKVLVCPYHAWVYELSGLLRSAPGGKRVRHFDSSNIRLGEIRLEEFLGFVFVNLDSCAVSMDEKFAEVKAAILEACPNIESQMFAYSHSAEEHCHWLIAVENYNECYHCGFVHKGFSRGVIDPGSYDIRAFGSGCCLRHLARAASGVDSWYDTSGGDYASFYLFPSFSLQIYPSFLVNGYDWVPFGLSNTVVHRSWYSLSGEVDSALAAVIRLDRETTFAEDLSLVRGVQAGVCCLGYEPGPLIIDDNYGIRSEHSIAVLHRWVRDKVGFIGGSDYG